MAQDHPRSIWRSDDAIGDYRVSLYAESMTTAYACPSLSSRSEVPDPSDPGSGEAVLFTVGLFHSSTRQGDSHRVSACFA
jgi:hypothetical protein